VFDALVELCRNALSGDAAPPPSPEQERTPRLLRNQYVHLVVPAELLTIDSDDPGPTITIPGVGPVSREKAHGLLPEAFWTIVITKGIDVLNVTHLGRSPTATQLTALLIRDGARCRVSRCGRPVHEHHHDPPWTQTHHTRLDELIGVCGDHHDWITRGLGGIERDPDGEVRWIWFGDDWPP
jgi:hypothetical protein